MLRGRSQSISALLLNFPFSKTMTSSCHRLHNPEAGSRALVIPLLLASGLFQRCQKVNSKYANIHPEVVTLCLTGWHLAHKPKGKFSVRPQLIRSCEISTFNHPGLEAEVKRSARRGARSVMDFKEGWGSLRGRRGRKELDWGFFCIQLLCEQSRRCLDSWGD